MFNDLPLHTARLIATALIWAIVGIIAILSIVIPGEMSSGAVILTALGLIFAHASTNSVWKGERTDEKQAEPIAKRKRGDGETKVDVLMSMMDDDEREAFKQALQSRILGDVSRLADHEDVIGDDGELSLDDLDALLERDARSRGQ
ncbi:MAG: hypothetical protein AAF125_03405 [Chloroflexota bacterium]